MPNGSYLESLGHTLISVDFYNALFGWEVQLLMQR